ncbi:D-aminoacyl-tRNA deacylase-like [Bolinopsis microptera]|uniref:D-aminoacyl-tRNA deacylase-like n=1 Tax=Bolinopsis microptera TaxID=2820187 RepID=UPI00307AAA73
MRAIVQKVTKASVTIGDRCTGSIGPGMCVLLGISTKDTEKEIEWMANKLVKLRIFNNPETDKPWDADLLQCKLAILVVSQFTLQCVLKGNKPDFHGAMRAEQSEQMYNKFLEVLKSKIPYSDTLVQEGEFGAFMQVHIQNDGPVTIPIDTPESLATQKVKPSKSAKQNNRNQGKKKAENAENSTDKKVEEVTEDLDKKL